MRVNRFVPFSNARRISVKNLFDKPPVWVASIKLSGQLSPHFSHREHHSILTTVF